MNNIHPLISCIIPVYNAEKYLARCLESVLAQDYPYLEIILIDDGSSDASGAICDTYEKAYHNVHISHISNGGASLARKKGLEKAKGDYVAFVDSDDYVAPNYISAMHELIERYGTKISACGVARVKINENDNFNHNGEGTVNVQDRLLSFEELMPRFFKYEFWGFWGGLYHRSVFEGLTFPKATLSEDYYVKTQMFCKERQMSYTPQALYFYEYHDTSLSHTKLSLRAFEEFENVKAVYNFVLEHCPEYSDYALSNVIETAVKLCLMKNDNCFDTHFAPICYFLRTHRNTISNLAMLNRNVRFIAYGLTIIPSFTCWAIKKTTNIHA